MNDAHNRITLYCNKEVKNFNLLTDDKQLAEKAYPTKYLNTGVEKNIFSK